MKKSVVILIGVIYVAAIALVSFFGINPELLEETIYVSNVELVDDDIQISAGGSQYVVVYLDEDGKAEYQLNWRVTPTNASNTKMKFSYDDKEGTLTGISVDKNGLVKFDEPGAVTIRITPADGTVLNPPVEITIFAVQL